MEANEIDDYRCPLCHRCNEMCKCEEEYDPYDYDWEIPWMDYDDDVDATEDIICEVNGIPMTKRDLEDMEMEARYL